MDGLKFCPDCERWLDIDKFYEVYVYDVGKKIRHQSLCKKCRYKRAKARKKRNERTVEEIRESNRKKIEFIKIYYSVED